MRDDERPNIVAAQRALYEGIQSYEEEAKANYASVLIDRDSLRKALDDRWSADMKAAKAIFVETGRTKGFPPVRGVVAWYVAEVERLECERGHLKAAIARLDTENDSTRTKLDRVEEAVNKFLSAHRHNILGQPAGWCVSGKDSLNEAELFARTVLPELSADAEFNRGMRQVPLVKQLLDVKAERDSLRAEVERLGKANSSMLDDIRELDAVCAVLGCGDSLEPASEYARSALDEVESLRAKLDRAKEALKPFAKEADRQDTFHADDSFGVMIEVRDLRRAATVYADLSADAPAQQTQISDETKGQN